MDASIEPALDARSPTRDARRATSAAPTPRSESNDSRVATAFK
jgi:hypothetical protein